LKGQAQRRACLRIEAMTDAVVADWKVGYSLKSFEYYLALPDNQRHPYLEDNLLHVVSDWYRYQRSIDWPKALVHHLKIAMSCMKTANVNHLKYLKKKSTLDCAVSNSNSLNDVEED